ncbi:hypothetical protein EF913_23120 [Streptomyces sp. WAC04189]|uniref:hypothetical protein n=1 Tax=Streptomyces TaxID=1883 RepID=UPI000F9BDD80|nr:hypothetical protein [Streptomyces sp. WAC04189]RSR99568.1 hypothetical protein EF913_23120 [Streptomyces sp. WAC04189]
MPELTPEQERDNALTELARLRAGLAAGLTPEQSARIQGTTLEEMAADATALAAELGLAGPSAPAPRSGGNRGGDVGSTGGTAAGAERFRAKHPQRVTPAEQQRRTNPYAENGYTMENR